MAKIRSKAFPLFLFLAALCSAAVYFVRGNTRDSTAAVPAPASSDVSPVTITFYPYYSEELGRWDRVVREFERRYPKIRVQVFPVFEKSSDSNEAMKQIDFLSASGREMDVVMLASPGHYAKRAAIGMLEPLNRFIAEEGLDVTREYKVDTSIDGKHYALPGRYYEWLTVLNVTHLEEAGLPVPRDWTWDEYLDYAKKLTIGNGVYRRYGTFFRSSDFHSFRLLNEPEPYLLKADGTSNLGNPAVADSLRIRYQAEVSDQSSTPYAYTLSQKIDYRPHYFNQAASMLITGSWFSLEAGGTVRYPATFKTAFAPLPRPSKLGSSGATTAGSDFLGISVKSRHKKEAYQFIRWYTTEGMAMQSSYVSSWRKPDLRESVDRIVESARRPELIDKASLLDVLSRSKSSVPYMPRPYLLDVEGAFSEETELFLLKQQDLETTVANGSRKVDNIIRTNASNAEYSSGR